ncbi:MAG: hypothetical protein HUJ68_09775 [Clostridia bacterium]|nr:hypothetical protein [Clostridia bacterium]
MRALYIEKLELSQYGMYRAYYDNEKSFMVTEEEAAIINKALREGEKAYFSCKLGTTSLLNNKKDIDETTNSSSETSIISRGEPSISNDDYGFEEFKEFYNNGGEELIKEHSNLVQITETGFKNFGVIFKLGMEYAKRKE